jgi:hypothetical protein
MSAEPIGYGEFVRLVIEALEAAGVEYLIGGAVAAWAWGEPRSTLDLDLVVDLPLEAVVPLSIELDERDMLVPPDIILENLLEARADLPIKAIHMHSGFKADLYPLRPGDELRQSALKRRVRVDLGPPIGQVFIHSPEDLIIYKTWYFSLGRQTKHLRDISAVLAALGGQLDVVYMETWMERQGVLNIWKELLDTIQHDE